MTPANHATARLYVAAHPPADDAPVYRAPLPEARFADAAADLDAFEDQAPPEAEPEDDDPAWRWALAVIAAGCAVVFGVVPLVRWW